MTISTAKNTSTSATAGESLYPKNEPNIAPKIELFGNTLCMSYADCCKDEITPASANFLVEVAANPEANMIIAIEVKWKNLAMLIFDDLL